MARSARFIQRTLCSLLLGVGFTLAGTPQSLLAQELQHTSALEAQLPTTTGDSVSLADYKGSIVLLHFVASWCGECILEAPSLNSLTSAFEGRDFVVVAVSIDNEVAAATAFSEQLKLSYPVLVDTRGALKRKLSVRGVPMTVVLSREGEPMQFTDPTSGRLVSRIEGPRDWASAAARASIERLLLQTSPDSSV